MGKKKPPEQPSDATSYSTPEPKDRLGILSVVAQGVFPTITSPASGAIVAGGVPIDVGVSTNRTDRTHTVRILVADSGTVVGTATVTFPNGSNPGTARITLPSPGTEDVDYILEVSAGGQTHRVVVRVPAAPNFSVSIAPTPAPDSGSGTIADPAVFTPIPVRFNASRSGGTANFTYSWYLYSGSDTSAPIVQTGETGDDFLRYDLSHIGTSTGNAIHVVVKDSSTQAKVAFARYVFNVR